MKEVERGTSGGILTTRWCWKQVARLIAESEHSKAQVQELQSIIIAREQAEKEAVVAAVATERQMAAAAAAAAATADSRQRQLEAALAAAQSALQLETQRRLAAVEESERILQVWFT